MPNDIGAWLGRGRQHDRRGELDRRRDEARHEPGEDAARHERHDDAAHGARLGGAEVLRGLFQRHVQLLQRGHARAQRVRQAAHRVGEHQRDPVAVNADSANGKLEPAEGAQVADAEDHARDRQRRGRGPVEQLAPGKARAQDDVGDRGADDHVEQRGEAAVEQGVADHAGRPA
jgi:hypothetical protein